MDDFRASGEDEIRRVDSASARRFVPGRIDSIDKDGPYVNWVIEVNPDAIDIADRLDAERKSGKVRGALHRIPILIKDNIDTRDRMQTTAGSLALEGHWRRIIVLRAMRALTRRCESINSTP